MSTSPYELPACCTGQNEGSWFSEKLIPFSLHRIQSILGSFLLRGSQAPSPSGATQRKQ